MNFYKRHLGDYAKKAGHLSALEHGVFNLILDGYYDREHAPTLTEAVRWARARTEEEKGAVVAVLDEFFTEVDGRYVQSRVEEEIALYRQQAETNQKIAAERERRKRERRVDAPTNAQSTNEHESCTGRTTDVPESSQDREPSHKPLATSHKPLAKEEKEKTQRASRLPASWAPSVEDIAYCQTERPELDPARVAQNFRDYWHAKAGKDACKLDWSATWRTWVRNERSPVDRRGSGSAGSDKFQVASIDHSSSVAAMEENMRLRGVTVPVGDELIEF